MRPPRVGRRRDRVPAGALVVAALLVSAALSARAQDPPEGSVAPAMDVGLDGEQPGANDGGSNDADPDRPSKPTSGWAALPVATYAPETHLGLGAFAVRFFRVGVADADSRPSSIAGVALLTTREQAVFELIPELYWDHERWRFWSKLDYRLFPNSFWGVGNNTPEANREWYQENGPRLQAQLRRRLEGNIHLEARMDAQIMRVRDVQAGGLLDREQVSGANGGRVFGIGPTLIWDTRDHLLVPRTGGFYELSYMQFHRFLGGEFNFARMEANLRRFIPIGSTHVLALQAYAEGSVGRTPFHRLALVGGQRLLRGYFEGRYRDRYMLAAQAEYRLPLVWRLGAVAFAGAGDVAPTLGSFSFNHVKWSVGGGLRFRLNNAERLNLRADVGVGHQTWGLYVGIAEAF